MKVLDRVPERIADWLEGAEQAVESPWPAWSRAAVWGVMALASVAIYVVILVGAWTRVAG